MAYGEQLKEEMKVREAQLRNFFANVDAAIRKAGPHAQGQQKWSKEEMTLSAAQHAVAAAVHARLLDSIDTRGAMDALTELVKAVNIYLASRQDPNGPPVQAYLLRQCAGYVTKILSVFGLAPSAGDSMGFGDDGYSETSAGDGGKFAAVLDAFCSFRDEVRKISRSKDDASFLSSKVLSACDVVRDTSMVDLGIRLEDLPEGGSVWKKDDPTVLKAERDEKRKAAAAVVVKKLKAKHEKLQKEVEKMEKLLALPTTEEALKEKYSKFDPESGEPTHDAEGNVLEGKALDKSKKDFEKAKKVRAPLEKKIAEEGVGFMVAMRDEVRAVEEELARMQLEE